MDQEQGAQVEAPDEPLFNGTPQEQPPVWQVEPRPRRKGLYMPRGANFSPHRVTIAESCLARFQWRYHKDFSKRWVVDDFSGPEAMCGKLCHGVYEDAVELRLHGHKLPGTVSVEEALHLLTFQETQLAREKELDGPISKQVYEAARDVLVAAGPQDVRYACATEKLWALQVTPKLRVGGRIDRLDLIGDAEKPDRVKVVDYKTNQLQFTKDELYYNTQFGLYLAWAKREWPDADIVFEAVMLRHGATHRIRWTQAHQDYHLSRAANAFNLSESGINTQTPGEHCRWCPYREGDNRHRPCAAYQKMLNRAKVKKFAPGSLEHLSMGELLIAYKESSDFAALFENRRKEAKKALMPKLKGENFRWGDLLAVVSRNPRSEWEQQWEMLHELASAAGVDPRVLFQDLFKVKKQVLDRWITGLGDKESKTRKRCEEIADEHRTILEGSPKLSVRRTQSMF